MIDMRMVRSCWWRLALVALSVIGMVGLAVAGPSRSDALVLVLVRDAGSNRTGNAFVIGDGSLAVTSRHVIYGNTHSGDGESMGLVSLISPYLGDTCEARIVAEDSGLDLAILRSSWKGHPSVELADEKAMLAAITLEAESRFEMVQALAGDELANSGLTTQMRQLLVDYVGVRSDETRIVALNGTEGLGAGWSGSAVFLPGSSRAVGCLSTVKGNGPVIGMDVKSATAFSVTQVRVALEREGRGGALQPHNTMPRPADADEVTRALLRISLMRDKKEELDWAKGLVAARPANAFCRVLMAGALERRHQTEAAETNYRKALELDRQSLVGRVLYAQMLAEGRRYDESMRLLEQLRGERCGTIWAIGMWNILNEQSKPAECLKVVQEALAVSPRNPRLLVLQGQSQRDTGDHVAAVASLKKAMALGFDAPGVNAVLGGELEAIGALDEAEAQFRMLTQKCPSESRSHFMLANFLSKRRPAKVAEAIAELEQALSLPAAGDSPSRELMQDMLSKLKARQDAGKSELHFEDNGHGIERPVGR